MTAEGKYVVIEGHDGTGKSTQVELLRQHLFDKGIESIEIQEPGGSPIADAIREVIKDGRLERSPMTNLLLFNAARSELWHTHAKPALNLGKWVVASRNYWSTEAYQGYGEGLNLQLIDDSVRLATDSRYMQPDIGIILDLEDDIERLLRISKRGGPTNPDTFESKDDDFQNKVRFGYLAIAKTRHLPVISASQNIEDISMAINKLIDQFLKASKQR